MTEKLTFYVEETDSKELNFWEAQRQYDKTLPLFISTDRDVRSLHIQRGRILSSLERECSFGDTPLLLERKKYEDWEPIFRIIDTVRLTSI